jgi:hypothetical protein
MATKQYKRLSNFKGVNRAISERDTENYLHTLTNMDSNLEEGMLVSRAGSLKKQSSGSTPNIDKFVMYRDEEWAKDVLLVYDKNATAASRKIYAYTRTSETDDLFAPHSTASYAYGSLRFGDEIDFMVHRNSARIGTGTLATNKAMFMGYIDRRTTSEHDAMFNDAIEFNDLFLLKQQWVQQESLLNYGTTFVYDSTREKYYIMTLRGLEVKDSNFYTERILSDITSYNEGGTRVSGNVALTGNSLYAVGKVPGSNETKLILYDLSNDFEISASDSYDLDATSETIRAVATDGTLVYTTRWLSSVPGESYIDEYQLNLSSSATRYTTAAGGRLLGITTDGTYVYACDTVDDEIVQMTVAPAYTTAKLSTAALPEHIVHYSGTLYFTRANVVYSTPAGVSFPGAITPEYTDTNQANTGINFIGAVPYLTQRGRVVYFDNATDWNEDGYIPTKLALEQTSSNTDVVADMSTFFYALSIIDIYGQESHLHRGCAVTSETDDVDNVLRISVNVDSENFAEMTSPSTDPAEELSVWNEFRRIKKIRIYRAYNEVEHSSEPTTDYTFLTDIDINDTSWTEVTANVLYTIKYKDTTLQTDISTVTYEESSGLPETFKPYYTNWQHGIKYNDRYYYGNLRTDELNRHQIIETPINAPDMVYQHDENIDYFYPGDGDEIKGFAQVWSRLVVFKGNNAAIYNGLTQENAYNIGTNSPDSILVHNNVVYFSFGKGIYALTPSGYKRISEPVNEILDTENTLTDVVSAVHFKEKEKLWFLVSGSNSYMYNYTKDTWDVYDIQSGSRDAIFIGEGLDDTIFTADENDDFIYKENTGVTDAGSNMTITVITNDIALGDGYLNNIVTRLFLTFKNSTDTIPVTVTYRNENGSGTSVQTFAASSSLTTLKKYLSGVYGQYVRFSISKAITKEVRIDAFAVEYIMQQLSRIQNAS